MYKKENYVSIAVVGGELLRLKSSLEQAGFLSKTDMAKIPPLSTAKCSFIRS